MARPHPTLVALAAQRDPGAIADSDDGLLGSAIDHGMHGLLWSWVRDHVPGYSSRAMLAGADLVAQRWHGRLWETLVSVQSRLAAAGIEVATVKGVTAEARWYSRVGERPCSDLDLLLSPDASARAEAALDVLQPDHPLRREINALVRSGVMQSVNVEVDDVPVDLHFDLLKLGIPTQRPDVVWDHTVSYPLPGGATVRVPDSALSLVHLLLHLNKDSFAWLLGYADIARVLRDDQLDWSFVDRFLRAEGLEVAAYSSLATVTGRLALPTPEPLPVRGPRVFVWRAVWPERVTLLGSAGSSRSRRQDLLPFLARGRFADALRWGVHVVFPPSSTVALRYGDIKGPYAWRLARGRARTVRRRRVALRARHATRPVTGEPFESPRDPRSTASVLREAARARPLWIEVRGRSMGRSIPDGSKVRVEPAASPRRGEVWAFCDRSGSVVVHRRRGPVSGGARFQGDARVRPDEVVPDEQLIGRVIDVAPHRARLWWGPAAGAAQRTPRVAIAMLHRGWRWATGNR
jgi:hypothetical protein